MKPPMTYEWNNTEYTVQELADMAGISRCQMYNRLNHCATLEEAVKPKFYRKGSENKDIAREHGMSLDTFYRLRKKMPLEEVLKIYRTKEKSIRQLAIECGILPCTLYKRLEKMTLEEALKMPVKNCGRKHGHNTGTAE